MQRRTIFLIATLGAVALTLATAWIPPLVHPPVVRFPGVHLEEGGCVPWIGPSRMQWTGGPMWLASEGRFGIGVRETLGCLETQDLASLPDNPTWHYLIASGWPFFAFHGGGLHAPVRVPITDSRAPAALELPKWFPTRQPHAAAIPVAPLWLGLLANLCFWTAAIGAPFAAARALLRTMRRRRRCCEVCGYRLVAPAARCSECGAPTRARASSN